jgi:spermidine/putrescine transport system permease protein
MSNVDEAFAGGLNGRLDATLGYIRERDRLQLLLFVGPATAFMVGALVLPLVFMVGLSFLTGFPPAEFTLENYTRIVDVGVYASIIADTVVLTIQTLVVVLVVGYMLSYGIAMYGKYEKVLLLLLILPFWTNYLVRNFAVIAIFQRGGPLDQLLGVFLIQGIENVLYSRAAVLMGLVYSFLPVAALPLYASISRMDKSLIDASKDLGAGPIKTFFLVTIPQTKDGIFVGSLLVGVPTFGAFVTPKMLGGPRDNMIGSIIEHQYMSAYDIPFGSALGTMTSLFVLVVLTVVFTTGGVPMIDDE